jgi:hypothetical protein
MLTKPWNLYIFRHSSLTEKSKMVTEAVLRKHAGWTMSSEMPQVYIHLQDESSNIILEKYGIVNNKDKVECSILKSKYCPNCNEPNKTESKFCGKCKMILSYDSYTETIDKQNEKDEQIKTMMEQLEKVNKYMLNMNAILENSVKNLNQSNEKITKLEAALKFVNPQQQYSLVER